MAVVLVTGGSSGIGLATVRRLAAAGDRVFSASRSPAAVMLPEEVSYLSLDLADPESCEAAVRSVADSAGRLDVLVNNAGTGSVAPLEETGDTEAHRIFEVNVFGPMRLVRAALPVMRAQGGGGRIVNVTSVNDIAPAPFNGWYSASKAALASLSTVLGAELYGSGIFVTVIAPGFFRSAMAEQLPSFPVAEDSRYATALFRLRASNAARPGDRGLHPGRRAAGQARRRGRRHRPGRDDPAHQGRGPGQAAAGIRRQPQSVMTAPTVVR